MDTLVPSARAPRVGLLVTCLVDVFRPQVGFAAVKLLEAAGCEVEVPVQACCGQPAYNGGARAEAAAVARRTIAAFEAYDHVVVPSGSCAGMVRKHYPDLFEGTAWEGRARALSAKTHELTSFLVDVLGVTSVDAAFAGTVTYHDGCSGLRELGIKDQPRRLLESVRGLKLREHPEAEVCCGFGGTFCVKYPEISDRMVEDKCRNIREAGGGTLLAGDLGCLLNMAGKLDRLGSEIRARHVAEVLAGMGDEPAIARGPKED